MNPLSPDTLDDIKRQLDASGYDWAFVETYGGDGFALRARRHRVPSTLSLREACVQVALDEPKHSMRTGDLRVRLTSIATRFSASPKTALRLLQQEGLTAVLRQGQTWIIRDAAWWRFVSNGEATNGHPRRTPVV